MLPKSHPRPLTFQLTLTVLALAALALSMAAGFGLFAIGQTDEDSLRKQRIFVANGLAEQVEALKREQESVTVWNDSVVNAKAGNRQWMIENIGEWMHSYYGHDRVYVLDDRDRPVYAMQDGQTVESSAYAADEPAVLPKLGELRILMRQIADGIFEEPPKAVEAGLVSLEGRPAILSIMPIVPDTDRVEQEPGSEYVHVSLKYIDEEVVGAIARQYLLSGAHLASSLAVPVARAAIPLVGENGAILGYIAWDQDKPGMSVLGKAAPALAAASLLAVLVLAYLLRRLRRASAQLQSSQDEAQYLAFHDTLTRLPNRALFEDRLKRALVSARRESGAVALLYIDLDRFKHVNDTLGHPAGDELVRQAAARLESSIREVDTVARLGGDEFAVVLVGIKNLRVAEDLAEKLVREISQPFMLKEDQVFIGASIGIAYAASAADPDDLLRKADIALYEAKKKGRGRYEVFAGDMDDILLRKRQVETDLREALGAGGQLKLDYQPVFAADAATIVGAEALIRWDHPVHGALPPAQFVSIAEERGVIGQLGEWVLREAVRFAAGTDLPWIAVNVSPLQLRDETFAEVVLARLAEAGLSPQRLQIEITENVLIDNAGAAAAVLTALRSAGIRLALDDFGTGYASINYLRRYPIDKLKIDRSFVRMLGTSAGADAMVKALIDLARALNVTVTAEGVDTVQQRDLLTAMGCAELQGFLVSPPVASLRMRTLAAVGQAPAAAVRAG